MSTRAQSITQQRRPQREGVTYCERTGKRCWESKAAAKRGTRSLSARVAEAHAMLTRELREAAAVSHVRAGVADRDGERESGRERFRVGRIAA